MLRATMLPTRMADMLLESIHALLYGEAECVYLDLSHTGDGGYTLLTLLEIHHTTVRMEVATTL